MPSIPDDNEAAGEEDNSAEAEIYSVATREADLDCLMGDDPMYANVAEQTTNTQQPLVISTGHTVTSSLGNSEGAVPTETIDEKDRPPPPPCRSVRNVPPEAVYANTENDSTVLDRSLGKYVCSTLCLQIMCCCYSLLVYFKCFETAIKSHF